MPPQSSAREPRMLQRAHISHPAQKNFVPIVNCLETGSWGDSGQKTKDSWLFATVIIHLGDNFDQKSEYQPSCELPRVSTLWVGRQDINKYVLFGLFYFLLTRTTPPSLPQNVGYV